MVDLVPVDHDPFADEAPVPAGMAPMSPQQRYRAAQFGDQSRLPQYERTGPTLPGAIWEGLADTGRMMTTPPPKPPPGYSQDDAGRIVRVDQSGRFVPWEQDDPAAFGAYQEEMAKRAQLAPSVALGMIGGGAGFAEKGAAGMAGGFLRSPLANAEEYKAAAMNRAARGLPSGQAAEGWIAKAPPVPQKGTPERALAEFKAPWESARDQAIADFQYAANPNLSAADRAYMESPGFVLGSGATDKRLGAANLAAQAARGAPNFKRIEGPTESHPDYVYHATNTERAGDILEGGKLNTYRPHEFTDQSVWPDQSREKRNYFTPTAQNTWQFAPEEGTPTLLRIKREDHPFKAERGTGDLYSTKPVPASKIEYQDTNGQWMTLGSGATDERLGAANLATQAEHAAAAPQPGIRAYHGSPHDFDQFDISKIGTGEGAQAYGHGLYFAEAEGTAKSYREKLAGGNIDKVRPDEESIAAIRPKWDEVVAKLQAAREKSGGRMTDETAALQNHLDALNDHAVADTLARKPWLKEGRMYEVNIAANPEHFLDWDKPLSEQSGHVRSAYQKLTGTVDPAESAARVRTLQEKMDALAADRDPVTNQMRGEREWMRLAKDRDVAWEEWNAAQSGQKFYHNLPKVTYSIRDNPTAPWRSSGAATKDDALKLVGGDTARVMELRTPGKDVAAQRLRDAGIPGIKYLDQGSRGAGTGTSNYVVFDPKLIEIVKKYGIAGMAAFPAGAHMLEQVDHDPFAPGRATGGRVNPHNINHAPTEAQKEAGNYAKDHVRVHGLNITIENAKGAMRSGMGRDGKPWSVKMPAAYGYIKGTVGRDKDHVDVYIGPHVKSPHVFVVDQVDADSKRFDEHKAFVGFASAPQAKRAYLAAFSDGRGHARLGHMAEMSVDAFKRWLENGDTTKRMEGAEHDHKLPHSAVGYVAHSHLKGKHCSVCTMFRDGPSCTLVRNPIAAGGWCRRFEAKG